MNSPITAWSGSFSFSEQSRKEVRAAFNDMLRAWGLQAEQVRALRPVVVGLQACGSITGRQASRFYDLLADLPE